MEGGLWPDDWWFLFMQSHAPNGMGGLARIAWPDGRSTLEQPALVVNLFTLMRERLLKHMERESNG